MKSKKCLRVSRFQGRWQRIECLLVESSVMDRLLEKPHHEYKRETPRGDSHVVRRDAAVVLALMLLFSNTGSVYCRHAGGQLVEESEDLNQKLGWSLCSLILHGEVPRSRKA